MEAIQYSVQPDDLKAYIPQRTDLICREINTFLFENKEFKTIFCEKEAKHEEKKVKLKSPVLEDVQFFLRFENGQISIIIPDDSRKVIAFGKNNTYFASETVRMELSAKKVEKFSSVVMHSVDFDHYNDWYKKRVYTLWIEEKPPGVYLAPFFEKIGDDFYTQERFAGDLLNYKGQFNKALCWRDLNRSIMWMNGKGICHGDVKPINCLIKEMVDSEGVFRPVSLLTDFDFTDRPGSNKVEPEEPYSWWDPCMKEGSILSLYTDLYGLAFTFVLGIFKINDVALANIRDQVFNDLRSGKEAERYEIVTSQLEHEKKVWALFYRCLQREHASIHLFRRGKREGRIQAASRRGDPKGRDLRCEEEVHGTLR